MSKEQGPDDVTAMADEFPSPEPGPSNMDIQSEFANQVAAEAVAAAVNSSTFTSEDSSRRLLPTGRGPPFPSDKRQKQPTSPSLHHAQQQSQIYNYDPRIPSNPIPNSEQIKILRDYYAVNPTPNRRELEQLAKETGRHWIKIREYFRQRRNKLRGIGDLELLDEPARAMGWLQVTYKSASPSSYVSQLTIYNSYKTRFDPFTTHTPLLGGQELIQLACATFTGCEMAKDEGDYVLKGLKEKEEQMETQYHGSSIGESQDWEKGLEALVEPLRAGSWLLNNFQQPTDQSSTNITQTDLYTSYATRFSTLIPESEDQTQSQIQAEEAELREFEANMSQPIGETESLNPNLDLEPPQNLHMHETQRQRDTLNNDSSGGGSKKYENRLLNPVELITLARMTFPLCEPVVDEAGRFVIKGLERRQGEEKVRGAGKGDMFPFALASAPSPSDPNHPFTSLLKRKLALLNPDASTNPPKREKPSTLRAHSGIGVGVGVGIDTEPISPEDKELIDGLRRFKDSRLGQEVRDVCVSQ